MPPQKLPHCHHYPLSPRNHRAGGSMAVGWQGGDGVAEPISYLKLAREARAQGQAGQAAEQERRNAYEVSSNIRKRGNVNGGR
jgi:hypothetical protein